MDTFSSQDMWINFNGTANYIETVYIFYVFMSRIINAKTQMGTN